MCTEASTLNPECLQPAKLVAILELISCFFKKNLMITRREVRQFLLCRNCTTSSVEISEGDMHEPADFIKSAFQNDAVEMVEFVKNKLPRRLVGQNHSGFYACLRRPIVKRLGGPLE